MIAFATRYDVNAQAASSTLAERLPAMCGSDTFTTVVSSTSIKVANITATATIHGLTCIGSSGGGMVSLYDAASGPPIRGPANASALGDLCFLHVLALVLVFSASLRLRGEEGFQE